MLLAPCWNFLITIGAAFRRGSWFVVRGAGAHAIVITGEARAGDSTLAVCDGMTGTIREHLG
ncbi:MAG: hypothetical protein EAZ40_09590 [Rhodobacterales bacterium]|nr:MAG: hypothetical protein EAZ40_09590 [Rhodobacterales bacterium]